MLHNPYDDDNVFEKKTKHQQNQQQSIVTNWKRNTQQNMLLTRIRHYGIYVFVYASEYDLFICFLLASHFVKIIAKFVTFQKRERENEPKAKKK